MCRMTLHTYLYTFFITILHVIPMGTLPGAPLNQIELGAFRGDYLIHSLVFVPWMFLRFTKLQDIISSKSLLNWLAFGVFFASAVEGIQYFLAYRSFNSMDILFNILGVLVGLILFVARLSIAKTSRYRIQST